MASNNKLTIIIDVNAKDAKTGIKSVIGDLSSVEKQADKTGGALNRMMSTMKSGAISALGFNEIAEALGRIGSYVGEIVSLQQEWSNLNACIKVATNPFGSRIEFSMVAMCYRNYRSMMSKCNS